MTRLLLVLTVLCIALLSLAPVPVRGQSYVGVVPAAEVDSAGADFVVALESDVTGLDPAVVEDTASLLVAAQIYDTLVAYQPGGSFPVPGLAQNWSVSADGLTWTFNLRPGISFHDGTPLNAEAVAFNIRRWWDPASPYHNGVFTNFVAIFGGFRGEASLIAGVSTIGGAQVQIVLAEPNSALPGMLAFPAFGIASPTVIQAGTLGANPVGTGPFRFVEWVSGSHIGLSANTTYWGGAPHLTSLVFQVMPDPAARFAALKSGAVQSAEGYAPGAATDPDLHPMTRPPYGAVGYLGINHSHAPLSNPLVQQAIAHAINRPALVASHYGDSVVVAQQFLPSGVWGYDPGLTDYSYDPALAKSLLTQAGFPNGFDTTLTYGTLSRLYLPDPTGTASAINGDLEAVGIHAQVVSMDWSSYLGAVAAGSVDLFLLGWGVYYPHPASFFAPVFCGSRASAFGPLDDLLCNEMGAVMADPSLSSQLTRYQWAAGRVHSTLPALPLVHTTTSSLTARWDVKGLAASPLGTEAYGDVYFGGVEAPIAPATGGTLVYTDPAGSPTTVAVPSAAVAEPVTLRLAAAENVQAPSGLGASGHAFDLTAFQGGLPLEHLAFAQSVALTVSYSDADVARLKEKTLALYTWDGAGWIDAATTCSPALPYVVDEAANQITVQICHLSRYALFGEKLPALYLPLIVRAGS